MDKATIRSRFFTQGLANRFNLSPQTRNDIAGFLFISPWLLKLVVLVVFAMLFSLGISFFETDLLSKQSFVGLNNYKKMLDDPLFWKSLRVTAFYTFGMVPLALIFALFIALLLNQKVVCLGIFRTLYYIPSLVSGVAVSILWMWILNPRFGLVNSGLRALGIEGPRWIYSETWALPSFILMGVWASGGNMLLYLAALQGIPTPLYESAKIDGANAWQCFWNITIPMLTPTIFFNLVMSIIGSFQVFTQAYVMTEGGPNNATLTMVLFLYRKGFEQLYFGYASAIAWTLFVIILCFTLLVVRSSAFWVYYAGELR